MIRFEMAETLLEARRLAREAVRQRLKERGLKLQAFSFKDLCEQANEYLRLHPEIIDLAARRLGEWEKGLSKSTLGKAHSTRVSEARFGRD
jgi:hypothetical protein